MKIQQLATAALMLTTLLTLFVVTFAFIIPILCGYPEVKTHNASAAIEQQKLTATSQHK